LGAFLLLLIPGISVSLTYQSEDSEHTTGQLTHVLLALGWGFGLVPYLAFCFVLFTGQPLTPWVVAVCAGLVTCIAFVVWRHRNKGIVPASVQGSWTQSRWVILGCLFVGLFYLLKYDRSVFFLESCIHRVVMQTLQLTDNSIDILSSNRDDQRLGNTAVISSFVVLFRGLGFRVLYAFVGFCMALGGYLLGRRLFKSNRWGWFVLFALPLNPYVAKIPLLDENILTLGYCSLFLPLMFRRKTPWFHVGLLFGLAIMMRHVSILSGMAMLWAVWCYSGNRWRAFAWSFGAFTLVTLVGHIHHYAALGSILKFESYGQLNGHLFPHRLLGNHSGLMQWPLAPDVIRTPWNPFPTFLMWPVYLVGHWGVILFSAMILGVVALYKSQRREAVFWLLWFGPVFLALSLQENWDVPNKMGVIYIIFHPIVLWVTAGLWIVFKKPRRWGVALVVVSVLVSLGLLQLRSVHVPMDERYYVAWDGERVEEIDYVQSERDRVTELVFWPNYARLADSSRFFHQEKWTGLLRDLENPSIDSLQTPYAWYPGEAVDLEAEPVTIVLDFSKRLFDRDGPWLTLAPKGTKPDIDLTQPGGARVLPNMRVDWTPQPVSVLVTEGQAHVTTIALIFEPWIHSGTGRARLQERYERGLQMLMGWGPAGLSKVERVRHSTTQLIVKVPAGPFGFAESLNNAGQNYLYWQARFQPGTDMSLEGPYKVFHN